MRAVLLVIGLLLALDCSSLAAAPDKSEAGDSSRLGQFDKQRDLYLAHFDLKTDVDDVHSVAAVATMLADRRFAGVNYLAVAGAYGTQEGLYVPANELFELAFGSQWADAHGNFDQALNMVSDCAATTLRGGGSIWIAEGGQSDFSAALIRNLQRKSPEMVLKDRIHIVQHADWNEKVTTAEDFDFVKQVATYHKIPSGNALGNHSPGFRTDERIDWQNQIAEARLTTIWEKAIAIANTYNGVDGRYLNESIKRGGLDFSDTVETTWLFGFNDLPDARAFFAEFSSDSLAKGE
ncbi:MAG: hypothetical protein AAGD11_13980 [Planctomycetota bacterium]